MASVMLYPCMFCVALSMDLFVLCVACLTVFVNCLVNMFGCVCFIGVEGDGVVVCGCRCSIGIDHIWSSIECVCCACGPSERLDAPSICFVCVFVCRK